jgi:hypothetical protein
VRSQLNARTLGLNEHRVKFDWLLGRPCTGIDAPTKWATLFSFGDARLYVETLWRVSIDGRLEVTSVDEGQSYGRGAPVDARASAFERLGQRTITAIRADVHRGDLTIEFGPSHLLEILTDSHYEPWQLTAPGHDVVATAGGDVRDLGT